MTVTGLLLLFAMALAAPWTPRVLADTADTAKEAEGPEVRLGLGAFQRQTERPRPEHYPESTCNQAGGICMPADECPSGQLAEPGLCPLQRSRGVECCHGLSVLERRCVSRGGQCMKECAHNLRDDHATDCRLGEHCCILVAIDRKSVV